MSDLSYHEIHLMRFLKSYCTLIFNKYVILLCFVIIHHKNLLISQMYNQWICDILLHNYLLQTVTSTTPWNLLTPTQRKPWNSGIYQDMNDSCKGDHESDLNCLASVILRKYTTVKKPVLVFSLDLKVKYSVYLFLISFWEAPWSGLVYYVQNITKTWQGYCAASIQFTT